jgi:hypothetical protein
MHTPHSETLNKKDHLLKLTIDLTRQRKSRDASSGVFPEIDINPYQLFGRIATTPGCTRGRRVRTDTPIRQVCIAPVSTTHDHRAWKLIACNALLRSFSSSLCSLRCRPRTINARTTTVPNTAAATTGIQSPGWTYSSDDHSVGRTLTGSTITSDDGADLESFSGASINRAAGNGGVMMS